METVTEIAPDAAWTTPELEVDTSRIVHIHSVIILRRSDKRKDRVEISPEQLSAASTEAEISFSTDSRRLASGVLYLLGCVLGLQRV
ncbi:hypothetical protein EK904_013062 [Melospiza melodia maxima]|nr:hypothetical protein EK904_013062 [Melospiza melodia maxima]